MNDQQLVTGLAILIRAYFQVQNGLSFYHWQIVTDLAWFSSVVHIASLPYLMRYFEKNRWLWYIRVFLMGGLAIMLAVGVVPNWMAELPVPGVNALPMHCVIKVLLGRSRYFGYYDNVTLAPLVVSEVLILGGLIFFLVQMHKTTMDFSRAVLKSIQNLWIKSLIWACEQLEPSPKFVQANSIPLVVFSFIVFISTRSFLHFLGSSISGVSHH